MTRFTPPGALSIDRPQVLVQSHSIMAYKCISKLAWWWPAIWHNHGLQVHLQLARSQPPSVSPNSHDFGLQVSTIMPSKCISPNSLDHGLLVFIKTRSITASKFGRGWPPSASPHFLDNYLEVYLWVHSITASKCISKYTRLPLSNASPNSLNHALGVNPWVHSIVILRPTSNCSPAPPAASPVIHQQNEKWFGSHNSKT